MIFKPIGAVLALLAVLSVASEAGAQLFGDRSLGGTLSGRATGDTEGVGSITGTERFIRGSRAAGDFVGADSRETDGFVGVEQGSASGQVETATEDLRIEMAPDTNQIQPQPTLRRTDMYRPRLVVGFDFTRPAPRETGSRLARQLSLSPGIHQIGPIEVSVEGRKATLRGAVASERERILAGRLALFEPGISEVQNDLTVQALPPPGTSS